MTNDPVPALFIGGLEVPESGTIADLMPLLASAYDLGPLPIVNGRLWSPDWDDALCSHSVTAKAVYNHATKSHRWAIWAYDGTLQLSRGGRWTSGRAHGKNLNHVRYGSAREAIVHYFAWKAKAIAWARRKLARDPNAVLNLPARL